MTTDVAERTETTAPDTQAQLETPTKTEETNLSSGTERDEAVQTGTQDEAPASKDEPDAEAVARQAEIEALADAKARADRAEEKRLATEATKKAEERQRAERVQGWLTPVLKDFADEYRADGFDDAEISRRLQKLVAANLSLTNDLKASIHIPIQDAVQEHITEVSGEDGYRDWAKENSGKPPADYFKGYAEAVAPESEWVKTAKADDIISKNKNLKAYITRQIAEAEKRGKDHRETGTAGSAPAAATGMASGGDRAPSSLKEAQEWHADPAKPQYDNAWMRAYKASH